MVATGQIEAGRAYGRTRRSRCLVKAREHRDDIPAMVAEFAIRYGERFGKPGVRVAPALVEALVHSEWPGNVRQLENTIAQRDQCRA